MVIVATDINVKCWAVGKAMESVYSSHETKLKGETIKSFDPFLNTLTHSLMKQRGAPKNIHNTSIELDESPLEQNDESKSSKILITNNNLKIPPLGRFSSIIANQVEDKDITKVATIPLIPGPIFRYA